MDSSKIAYWGATGLLGASVLAAAAMTVPTDLWSKHNNTYSELTAGAVLIGASEGLQLLGALEEQTAWKIEVLRDDIGEKTLEKLSGPRAIGISGALDGKWQNADLEAYLDAMEVSRSTLRNLVDLSNENEQGVPFEEINAIADMRDWDTPQTTAFLDLFYMELRFAKEDIMPGVRFDPGFQEYDKVARSTHWNTTGLQNLDLSDAEAVKPSAASFEREQKIAKGEWLRRSSFAYDPMPADDLVVDTDPFQQTQAAPEKPSENTLEDL